MKFISISEVIKAVAHDIPLPEKLHGGTYLRLDGEPSRVAAIKISMFNSLASTVYRHSEAAAMLDQHLHNAATELRPRWFDLGETGRPKLSDTAHDVAMKMLVHTANWAERFHKAYNEEKITWWSTTNRMEPGEGQFKTPRDADRMQEIGFDQVEICAFLDSYGIPYNFNDAPPNQETESKQQLTSLSNGPPAIPSPQISEAFDGCHWDKKQWQRNLGDPSPWLADLRVEKGSTRQDRPSTWNPLAIAIYLFEKKKAPLHRLKKAFNAPYLSVWRETWVDGYPEHWDKQNDA